MAKGADAKKLVAEKLQAAFGQDWIGEYDKKYYVWAQENGEKLQIAINLTCPKNPVSIANATGKRDFSGDTSNNVIAQSKFEPAEITQEEQDNIKTLLEKFNL
jgi:hypothetical protein